MKLWKRLAAGLLAVVTAIGATISAGAIEGGYISLSETREQNENAVIGYVYLGEHRYYYGDGETIETLTDLGTIENYGDPERETSILIPASQLENYPVGTVAIIHAKSTEETEEIWIPFYVRDGKRDDLIQVAFLPYGHSTSVPFMITKKMKENGILLTGYLFAGEGELSDVSTISVQSVEFTNSVAAEWELKLGLFSDRFEPVPIAVEGVNQTGILIRAYKYDEETGTTIPTEEFSEYGFAFFTPDEFSDIPVGAHIEFVFDTTRQMSVGERYPLDKLYLIVTDQDGKTIDQYSIPNGIDYIEQLPVDITNTSDLDDEALLYNYRGYVQLNFRLTEDMKKYGFLLQGPSDVFVSSCYYWVPKENSEIDPVDPVVTPGFSTPAGETSVKEVPLGTVVTQKTAVSDGRYGERFVKKVAASDVVGKTKATFTLSNGTATKTVSTTKYNTALTVDGETISAGSGYVFLVYTLSGIPEDVNVTVTGVTLE